MINVEHVSMKFRMANDRVQSLKEYVIAKAKNKLTYNDLWVFKDVNFHVQKGEVVGIIGRNGAGKSTLLKIIAGVLEPTEGKVSLNGNIVPMLELGSGFDIELSGRENIFLNGSILGYSEEYLKEKYDEIVEFSGLHDFMEVPIRNYSSGMLMRLAFSIATLVQPEILIVDEILAVGDEAFQTKSKRKMLELMSGGTTVLFVSHSIAQIRELCSRVVWLEDGKVKMIGDTKAVCDAYQEFINPPQSYTQEIHYNETEEASKYFMDVLFVHKTVKEEHSWRVSHRREQLLAGGVSSYEILLENFSEDLIKKYRIFIFVNCIMEDISALVFKIKRLNKIAICDLSYRELYKIYQGNIGKKNSMQWDAIIVPFESMVKEANKICRKIVVVPYVVSDRILQLAEWAKYDRDRLPLIDVNTIDNMELENYAKACVTSKERKKDESEGYVRIGYFGKGVESNKDNWLYVVIKEIEKEFGKIRLYYLEQTDEIIRQNLKVEVQKNHIVNPEEIVRVYSSVDVIIDFANQENMDTITWNWLIASCVKVPYIVYAVDYIECSSDLLIYSKENFIEAVKKILIDRNVGKELAEKNLIQVLKQHTSLATGIYFSRLMKDLKIPNVVYMVMTTKIESNLFWVLGQALKKIQSGYDVLILNEENEDNTVWIDSTEIPVLSKAKTYVYGSFDEAVATSAQTYQYFLTYPNINKKYYLLYGYEPDYYAVGEYARFSSSQTYLSCIEVTYLAVSEQVEKIMRERCGITSKVVSLSLEYTNYNDKNKLKESDNILVIAERDIQTSNLDECFRILLKKKGNRKIIYFSNCLSPKEWYPIDMICKNVTYHDYQEMLNGSDIIVYPTEGENEILKQMIKKTEKQILNIERLRNI